MKDVKYQDLKFVTSESVTCGHPDKVCDQISDAVLDAYLGVDPDSHVACEVFMTGNKVFVGGEVSSKATDKDVNIDEIVRRVLRKVGYTYEECGISAKTAEITNIMNEQSPDIAAKVAKSLEAETFECAEAVGEEADQLVADDMNLQGAGDQGIMFGYACSDTEERMPLPIVMAHRLAKNLEICRYNHPEFGLLPDGKTQVTVGYKGGRPVSIDTVLVSAQHKADVNLEELTRKISVHVVLPVLDWVKEGLGYDVSIDYTRVLINPVGQFVVGGPKADTGLTGRKIIVDTYGGAGSHGGGAFSGKDPSKVDRSGAYMARLMAVWAVNNNLCDRCQVQLSYGIGMSEAISVMVDTFGTGKLTDEIIAGMMEQVFDLRPAAIIHDLDLKRPIYEQFAAYGHFGREEKPIWENFDRYVSRQNEQEAKDKAKQAKN